MGNDAGAPPGDVHDDGFSERLRRRLLPDGDDPDPRLTLANERTFLAWTRTALALVGGGLAVDAFTGEVWSATERKIVAVLLIAAGVVCSAGSFYHWLLVERAMRNRRAIPLPLMLPLLTVACVAGTLFVLILFVNGLR